MIAPCRRSRPLRQFRARKGQHLPKTDLPSVTLSRLDYSETGSRSHDAVIRVYDEAAADQTRWVRYQPPVSDAEASRVANECEQVWREMSRKIAPRRYFTTADIADYIGLTQGQISKTARDPNSWLALFVICVGKGKQYRFVDPTGWLLGLWCGFERVKQSFPGATRSQVFKALRINGLEKGEPRRRFLARRQAAELDREPGGTLSSSVGPEA